MRGSRRPTWVRGKRNSIEDALRATGLWIGAAIERNRSDLSCEQGVLPIRESKFGLSRLVLGVTTRRPSNQRTGSLGLEAEHEAGGAGP